MSHRLGELALHRGGVLAVAAAFAGGAIAWTSTPIHVHHRTSYPCPFDETMVCHSNFEEVNDNWAEAVFGGVFGGAILGFLVANGLVLIGVPRKYLLMGDE